MYSRWFILILTLGLLVVALTCSKNSAGVDDDVPEVDNIAPAAVMDLRVEQMTTTSITLRWTSPGDDGNSGVAYEYDLRGAIDSITAATFGTAYQITDIFDPAPPGLDQWYTVDSLDSGDRYYFALKTRDEMGNWSTLSNCVGATCPIDQVVVFADTALDRVIRANISMPTGDIHVSDLDALVNLIAEQQNIRNLSGIENCHQLFALHVFRNEISDLSPLASLNSLRILNVADNNVTGVAPLSGLTGLRQLILGENAMTNLSPLAGLTNLEVLRINNTGATDYTPLYGMTQLTWLDVSWNPVADISYVTHLPSLTQFWAAGCGITTLAPLNGMTNAAELYIGSNQITSLAPLGGLPYLHIVHAPFNQIADLQPLVDNAGFGAGDELYLRGNPLSTTATTVQIPALEAKGVNVVL